MSVQEQRQTKNNTSRPSLQVEFGGRRRSTGLPKSIEERRSGTTTPTAAAVIDRKGKGKAPATDFDEEDDYYGKHLPHPDYYNMAADVQTASAHNPTNDSYNDGGFDGLAPALHLTHPDNLSLNSSNTSVHSLPSDTSGWGPQHPCYPHPNPYAALGSSLAHSTRIIRIPRSYMVCGDLAPTFSDLYPELLADAGISEDRFRRSVEELNALLIKVFSPRGGRNFVDGMLGLMTGWVWDDIGQLAVKQGVREVEALIERWNGELETIKAEGRWIGLRKSAYMSLDIQIPTPDIGEEAEADADGEGRGTAGDSAAATERDEPSSAGLGSDGNDDGDVGGGDKFEEK